MSDLTIRDATAQDIAAVVAMLADDEKGRFRENAGDALDPCYIAAFAAIDAEDRKSVV